MVFGCYYPFLPSATMNIFVSNIVNNRQLVAFIITLLISTNPCLLFILRQMKVGQKILQMEIIRCDIFCFKSWHVGSSIF